jgi:hypothetical protein
MGLTETHAHSSFGRIDRFTYYFGETHRKLLQSAQDFYEELSWTRPGPACHLVRTSPPLNRQRPSKKSSNACPKTYRATSSAKPWTASPAPAW